MRKGLCCGDRTTTFILMKKTVFEESTFSCDAFSMLVHQELEFCPSQQVYALNDGRPVFLLARTSK